ncbi:Double-strand break repair protein mre11a [Mortierella alpina]|uniref:Double-strand break repair protein n=1 Tax=Mortierella alpina TaxID=64518 RepID=A0A9P6M2L4_MORAP|nr:Double-strand break repair protein mre11a [Mortierella alpina]
MILLGGDLFHDNKPSRKTMYITTKLLRKYCMGDKPVSLEYMSDPSDNFPDGITTVNYMDSNLNVAIPVFSIHGNHDDPSGDGNLCALDQLAMTGLVNYFGRSQEIDKVVVNPILLRKGETKLALFGMGNIRDERLHQTFLRRKVTLMRPVDEEGEEPWYNLMVLHQNRVMHGPKSYIPEAFLDECIDLVIWGHEHECLIDPVYNPQQGFHVSQPGSSVATSLSEGESKEKHVAILKICKGKFNIQKIRLKSVRPFIMGDVTLSDHQLDPTDQQKVNSFISKRVRDLVRQANEDWVSKNGRTSRKRRMYSENDSDEEQPTTDATGEQALPPPKPLVRLRVEYSGGFEIFNPQRFGQEFVDLVANPRDIVHFYRKKTASVRNQAKPDTEMDVVDAREKLDTMRVENLVQKYLSAQNLSILPEIQLADAVRIYVEKDEKDAVKDFVGKSLDRMQKVMRTKQNIELEEALLKEINKEKDHQAETYAKEHPNGGLLDHKRAIKDEDMDMESEKDDDDMEHEEDLDDRRKTKAKPQPRAAVNARKPAAAASTSRAKATGSSRNTPAPSRGARSAKKTILAADSHDEEEPERVAETDSDNQDVAVAEASTSRGNNTHVILDSDEEGIPKSNEETHTDNEDDLLVPKRGAKAKGKARAKSPTKPKAAPKRRTAAAKKTAPASDAGDGIGSSGTAARTASQAPSQGPSQARSRLVSAIGSRRKKLL